MEREAIAERIIDDHTFFATVAALGQAGQLLHFTAQVAANPAGRVGEGDLIDGHVVLPPVQKLRSHAVPGGVTTAQNHRGEQTDHQAAPQQP